MSRPHAQLTIAVAALALAIAAPSCKRRHHHHDAGIATNTLPGFVPPGTYPGVVPGQVPGMVPGQVPGVIPGQVPGAYPGMVPGQVPGVNTILAPPPIPTTADNPMSPVPPPGVIRQLPQPSGQ